MSTFVIITGGGTGGHVYPALAVADELVARGHRPESVHFVGAARGLEASTVPAAGYAIDLLPGRGFRRRVGLRDVVHNLAAAGAQIRALTRALRIVRQHRPQVVMGVGGFAAAPTVLAARILGVPVVVHEQNAAPGVVNRLAVRLGARAAVSLPGTPLRGAVVTGSPVRREILAVRRLPPASPRVVGVVGGSLGAGRVNDAVLDLASRWRQRTDVAIHHVTGPRDHARCLRAWQAARRPDDRLAYEIVAYEHDMAALYARATVVVARAGAVTVAELAVTGTPAVLVPLPGAPGDHQHRNAEALARAGAAVELPDAECDGERLAQELDALLVAPSVLDAMSRAASQLARPDAAARVADLVEETARA